MSQKSRWIGVGIDPEGGSGSRGEVEVAAENCHGFLEEVPGDFLGVATSKIHGKTQLSCKISH